MSREYKLLVLLEIRLFSQYVYEFRSLIFIYYSCYLINILILALTYICRICEWRWFCSDGLRLAFAWNQPKQVISLCSSCCCWCWGRLDAGKWWWPLLIWLFPPSLLGIVIVNTKYNTSYEMFGWMGIDKNRVKEINS